MKVWADKNGIMLWNTAPMSKIREAIRALRIVVARHDAIKAGREWILDTADPFGYGNFGLIALRYMLNWNRDEAGMPVFMELEDAAAKLVSLHKEEPVAAAMWNLCLFNEKTGERIPAAAFGILGYDKEV